MEDLLPIGSVIVTNDNKSLMIIGYLPKSYIEDEYYDYICCDSKKGITKKYEDIKLGEDYSYILKKDIKSITYIGLQDDRFEEYKSAYKIYDDFLKEKEKNREEINEEVVNKLNEEITNKIKEMRSGKND